MGKESNIHTKRDYYEWLEVANAFVNNNKINGYDNNMLQLCFFSRRCYIIVALWLIYCKWYEIAYKK